nr:MAG TPA: hypothetical protein [Caudoviricetes sp.]
MLNQLRQVHLFTGECELKLVFQQPPIILSPT